MYINPYADLSGGRWIKANFHTHAGTGEGTCGRWPIDFVLSLYKGLNYGAVCISNHDLYTDTAHLDDGGMCLIQGVEYSQNEHMLTIGINKSVHELGHQDAIDETARCGGFTILCHPNWQRKEYWPHEKIDALNGYAGMEVINMLIYRLSGSGLALDTWDHVLRRGKLVYGFGDDDYHMPFDAGRGFTHIYVNGYGYGELKKSIDGGRFTASTGLQLEYLRLEDGIIKTKVTFLTETYVDNFLYKFVTESGTVAEVNGREAAYKINGESYIRVEAAAENGALLFTQPVWKKEFFGGGRHA